MLVYMVDRDLPRITSDGLAALQASAIASAQQLNAIDRPVRYIRSLYIPGEARCLCLFEAADEAIVAELNKRAALPFTRIVAALDLTPAVPLHGRGATYTEQPPDTPSLG